LGWYLYSIIEESRLSKVWSIETSIYTITNYRHCCTAAALIISSPALPSSISWYTRVDTRQAGYSPLCISHSLGSSFSRPAAAQRRIRVKAKHAETQSQERRGRC
jgi:hypothetical protein